MTRGRDDAWMAAMNDDVLARLDRLESIEAIRDLAHRYCWGADHRDLAVQQSVWAPGAVWQVSPERAFTGIDEVTSAVEQQWSVFPRMQHATSNHRIEIDGDRATGVADVVVMTQLSEDGDGAWVCGGGTYRDAYVLVDGVWLIARREATDTFLIGPMPTFQPSTAN